MKVFKALTSIILSLIIAASVIAIPTSASAVSTTKKSLLIYNSLNLTFNKEENDTYETVVSGNSKGYINVEASNDGLWYWLYVKSLKATTAKSKPEISVYKVDGDKKTLYKKYQITVNPVKKVKFSNLKFNKNVTKEVILKMPYDNKDYKFKYSKKIAKIYMNYFREEKQVTYNIKGLKKGSTTVKVYLSGTKTKVGSFKITVGNFKASVKKKKITISYNSHMKNSLWLEGGSINIGTLIKNFRSGATYTVKAKNKKLISSRIIKKDKYRPLIPDAAEIYSKKTGKTTLTVYEKRAKAKKKTKIGTIKLTVKKAKDADVFWSNRALDNDGIFYELFISPGQSYDLKSAVVRRYVNNSWTKSKFKASEYTFKATSNHPEIISVDKDGVCTCNTLDNAGDNEITYTITFKDGSKVSGSGSFDVWPEEDLPN